VNIEIFRDTGNNGCRKIKRKAVASRDIGVRSVELPVFEVGKAGRVFMDIIAEEDSEIYYMGIRTDNPPVREPGLSFGICACNHEENLLESLRELVECPEDEINIARIIVVNQGPDFKLPGLKELIAENDLIRYISREKSAGCMGFARTIYESLDTDKAAYHILMRDDVHIDRRILRNLSAFMAYLTGDVVIGGHTLDLLKPWFLYAEDAGGPEHTGGTPLQRNADLRRIDSLRQFSSSGGATLASWWFCAVPQKYLLLAGNFLPVSDRGDNLEFVTRLEKMGVITMGMPGIAVWRKP
jgi:galactofuranosylgalactofuranosylrhamnosyl-N-acetylglucosaminyl-diphospho-decaprenol beta-1,5/1,6-galactofuranosyltransferase